MQVSYQLPLNFDPHLLKNELNHIESEQWFDHFVKIHYEEGWQGIALRSADGTAFNLASAPTYQDTAILSMCPYFDQVLKSFKCSLCRVRLLKLKAGSIIKEHIDPGTGREQPELRIHIPIITSPEIEFYCDGQRIIMESGKVYFIDTSFTHCVLNKSDIDRVHLVIDCAVNEWLRSLFPKDFFATNWQYNLKYKLRVIKFITKDIWQTIKTKDRVEFYRRVWILIRELRVESPVNLIIKGKRILSKSVQRV